MKKPSPSVAPSFENFAALAKTYNRVPLALSFHADLETPLSAYLKLAKGPNGFLLESVEKDEQVARYSIVGFSPTAVFEAKDGVLTRREGERRTTLRTPDPLRAVQDEIAPVRQAPLEGMSSGFLGGMVGTVGYDAVRSFEKLPSRAPDVLDLPDLYLLMTDRFALFDHLKRTLRLVVNVPTAGEKNLRKTYERTAKELEGLARELEKPLRGVSELPLTATGNPSSDGLYGFRSNQRPEAFRAMVERTKGYVRAGDIIQAVVSQRFEKDTQADAVTVYRTLRRLNPSPYMFLLKMDGTELVGSSPEMLIKVQSGTVETRPIAGSRPRSSDPGEDKRLEEGLLADKKELAEHVMLVDLARNDLGRVCEFGTVKVKNFKRIERYSHVMHIVSDVEGKLAKGRTAYDALRSCFPAGTLSGAPKIRAMEIIDELEPSRRGIYGGAVVAFGFDGNMDSAITIRSVVLKRRKGGATAYVQAGAGIVADSVPESEYEESCNKARAVLMAVDLAEKIGTKGQHKASKTQRKTVPGKRKTKTRKGGKS